MSFVESVGSMLSTLTRTNLAVSGAGQQCQCSSSVHIAPTNHNSFMNSACKLHSTSSCIADRLQSYRRHFTRHSSTASLAGFSGKPSSSSATTQRARRRNSSACTSSYDVTTSPNRRQSLRSSSDADPEQEEEVSWSESLSRRWAITFRSRRSASCSTSKNSVRLTQTSLHRRLVAQYNVCHSRDAETASRIVAVFFCWYFGRIEFLYALLTDGGARRSNVRLALAVGLVTALMLLAAVSAVVTSRLVWTGLTLVVQSTLNFALLLVCLFAVTVAMITFLSFD